MEFHVVEKGCGADDHAGAGGDGDDGDDNKSEWLCKSQLT